MRVGVGIIGGGTVGGALARKLLDDREVIAAKSGVDLELIGVAVRDPSKARPFPPEYVTTALESLVSDSRVNLVVELMGGIEPARSLVLSALSVGKPVVTANKALLAEHGPEIFGTAAESGVSVLFEAAVGGGIPLIRPLSESLAGERITQVLGIVNGTTNYMLHRMESEGLGYSQVLEDAQRLGFAEADPSADVEGHDAAAKATILAGLAFGTWVPFDTVYREGIDGIDADDISYAASLGYSVKLLAIAEAIDGGVSVRVHPALVPLDHPLATVRGANNAVFVEGPAIGQLFFMGPGAGGDPTATAALGDVIDAGREFLAGTKVVPRIRLGEGRIVDFSEVATKWYLRLIVKDQPGVLASIASIFGENDVSIKQMWQEGRGSEATLLIITHDASESCHRAAVEGLRDLDTVRQVAARLRVVSSEP